MGEKGPEKSSQKSKPAPAPTPTPQPLKLFLDKASDALKDLTKKDLADIVSAPLIKGLNAVKDLKNYAEKNFIKIRVWQIFTNSNPHMVKAFEYFLKTKEERERYLGVLEKIYQNIGGEKFKDVIADGAYSAIDPSELPSESRTSPHIKFAKKGNFFKIELLEDLLEVSKAMPDNVVFLANKYLTQDYANRAYTKQEIEEYDYESRSFTLAEMLDILKKHGKKGETIINFVDCQKSNPDFENRKKFILKNLEQLKKLSTILDIPLTDLRYTHLLSRMNLDLLNEGDHIETLQRLLGVDPKTGEHIEEGGIDFNFGKSIDRRYIKDHAEKLFKMKPYLAGYYLPTRKEMDENGDLLLEIALKTGELPLIEHSDKSDIAYWHEVEVSKKFKRIYLKFGWASFFIDRLDKHDREIAIKAISLPENKELLGSLGEVSIAVAAEFKKVMTVVNPNAFQETWYSSKGILGRLPMEIRDLMTRVFLDSFKNEFCMETTRKLIENYNRYPKLFATLFERVFRILELNDPKVEIIEVLDDINILFRKIEPLLKNKNNYEKFSTVLNLISNLTPEGNKNESYIKVHHSSFEFRSIAALLDSEEKVDIICKNKDFIYKYLQKTKIISPWNQDFVNIFLEHFPFWAAEKYQAKLWQLAKRYSSKTLQALLFFQIKNEDDLNFYISNSGKLSGWLERTIPEVINTNDTELERLRELKKEMFPFFPSRYLLNEHFDYLNELTKQVHDNCDQEFIARAYGRILKSLNDDKFMKKNGKFFFEILRKTFKAERSDYYYYLDRNEGFGLGGLVKAVSSIESFPEEYKQKILYLFSRYVKPGNSKEISATLGIFTFFKMNPDLLNRNFAQLEEVLEEFLKLGFETGRLLPSELFNIISLYQKSPPKYGTPVFAKDNEILIRHHGAIMKIIKLLRIEDGVRDKTYVAGRHFSELVERTKDPLVWEDIEEALKSFFDRYGELPDKKDKEKYSNYQIALEQCHSVLSHIIHSDFPDADDYERTLELFVEKAGEIEVEDFDIINILEEMKCPEDVIEDYKNGPFNWQRRKRFILFDYSDNTDLREFNYKKISIYGEVFRKLRRMRYNPEDEIAEDIKLGRFEKEMAGKDFIEVEKIINAATNVISPLFGEILFKKIIVPKIRATKFIGESLKKWLGKDQSGKMSKMDVTQNNMSQINSIIRLLNKSLELMEAEKISAEDFKKTIKENIEIIFPEFVGTGNPRADIQWLLGKFDVEEINFDKLDSLAEFIEFQQLLSSMTESGIESASKYLENKMKDIDFTAMSFEGGNYSLFDMSEIENLRQLVNSKNKIMGDMLIDILGSKFLEANCCSFENIDKLLKFARAWENPGLDRDVDGLYQVYSTYAYVEVASFLKENLEKEKSDKDKNREMVKRELSKHGLDLDKLIAELEGKNYLTLTESNLAKAAANLQDGLFSYTFRKGASKLLGEESVEFEGKNVRMLEAGWTKRQGVKVYSLMEDGREIAKVIKCDPDKIKAKVLAEPDGVVNMDKESKTLGKRLIFSAPLTFTTGARKMTELAFRDGVQMNYLLSPYTKDGYLLVNEAGEQKVLNKKRLKISDLIGPEDLKDNRIVDVLAKWAKANKLDETKLDELLKMPIKPALKFFDKKTFFELLRIKRYSLLGGMLLIDKEEGKDEGTVVKLNDGGDSRRFYLEFSDGQFGIIDSTENISSGRLVDLALLAGATKAVYMDTGMYDMATYKDGSGEDHIMGHQDTSESTNRVVIYEK